MTAAPPAPRDSLRRPPVPWYRRFLDWLSWRLGGQRPDPRSATQIRRFRRVPVWEFTSPADGDAFQFAIRLQCTWEARVLPGYEAWATTWIDERHERVKPDMEYVVRDITRRYGARACAAVESAIGYELSDGRFAGSANGVLTFDCTVRAQVGLDPDLRDLGRSVGLAEVLDDQEQRKAKRDIERIAETVQLWQGLINRLQEEQATPAARQLALRPQDKEEVLLSAEGSRSDPGGDRLYQLTLQAFEEYRRNGHVSSLAHLETNLGVLLHYYNLTGSSDEDPNHFEPPSRPPHGENM